MADEIKISELDAVVTAAGTDTFPVVQGGVTKKETNAQALVYINANAQLEGTDQVTGLDAALAAKANDNAVVHLSGTETITGAKTFSQTIVGNISGNAATATTATTATTANALAAGALTDSMVNASAGIALSKLAALNDDFALVSNSSGVITTSAVTDTELGYVSGVTSAIQTQLNARLALAGGTMTGDLTLDGDPTTPNMAANKAYVDSVASGAQTEDACLLGTTANVPATYNNGTAGVGATLTVTATGPLTLDGQSANTLNARYFFKDQTDPVENGIYTLTTEGDLGVSPIYTRATDYNEPSEITVGDLVPLLGGDTQEGNIYRQNATVTTIGTDPIVFTLWQSGSNFLQRSNNLSDVASISTARTNLGLGTMATQNSTSVSITGGVMTGMSELGAYAPVSSSLLCGSQGIDNFIGANDAEVIRYAWGASGEESTGNAGYNPALFLYDDAGDYLSTAMFVSRATGDVTFYFDIVAANFSGDSSGTNTGDQFTSIATETLLGNPTGSSAAATAFGIGAGLAFAGGLLTADGSSGLNIVEVTGTTQAMAADTIYIANNASLVTFTLPATFAVGALFGVIGFGAGGWKISQNSGQIIHIGNEATTTGTAGYVSSTNQFDSLTLVSASTNSALVTAWGPQGNITVYQGA